MDKNLDLGEGKNTTEVLRMASAQNKLICTGAVRQLLSKISYFKFLKQCIEFFLAGSDKNLRF